MLRLSPTTGGCQCGAVRYSVSEPHQDLYVCHCSECRAQSSSAFGISVLFPTRALSTDKGHTKRWSRPTTSGSTMDCFFCVTCGTRLWHIAQDDPDVVSVKGGSLDQPPDLSRASHIWTASCLKGVIIPGDVANWPKEPPAK